MSAKQWDRMTLSALPIWSTFTPRATCTRQRHQDMGEDRRAVPGCYVVHASSKGDRDGDEDRPWDDEEQPVAPGLRNV